MKVVIIGAGVIGLSLGWQLARAGLAVTILERGIAGRAASWAAAGMLAPFWEAGFEKPELLSLGEESLALYPQFLEELSQDSSEIFEKESEGTLAVAIDRDDRRWLERHFQFKKEQGLPIHWLSGDEARAREPLLSPRVHAAIWIPSERHINNRHLLSALKTAFLAKGGILQEGVEVLHCEGHVQSTDGREWHADCFVHATGASCKNDVRPIKGQIVTLRMHSLFSLQHMVRTPRVYLAPKKDGSLRVGATMEDVGFDESVTAGAAMELLQEAFDAVPAVYEYSFEEICAALRPMSFDEMPIIGSKSPGHYLAVGHGRAGFLLAPYTAYKLKKQIMEDNHAGEWEKHHGCSSAAAS